MPAHETLEIRADFSDVMEKIAEANRVAQEFDEVLARIRRNAEMTRVTVESLRAAFQRFAEENEPSDADTSSAPTDKE